MTDSSTIASLTGQIRLSPPVSAKSRLPLVQSVELMEGDRAIATAIWFTTGNDGVIQLLDIRVEPGQQRRGVGTRLFKIVHKEANFFFKSRGQRLRRITAHAEQKTHIVARAFLTKLGFHHVQTIGNTLKDEDVLVYLLGCD